MKKKKTSYEILSIPANKNYKRRNGGINELDTLNEKLNWNYNQKRGRFDSEYQQKESVHSNNYDRNNTILNPFQKSKNTNSRNPIHENIPQRKQDRKSVEKAK